MYWPNKSTLNKRKSCLLKINVYSVLFILFLATSSVNNVSAAEFKVAVRAINGIEIAQKQWKDTIKYLSENIPQHTFKLEPIISLDELLVSAAENKFDFLLTNPSSYVELENYYGIKAIATLNNKRANTAQSRFGSVLFVHAANDDIFTIRDLRNRTVMAVDKTAFGGWRVIWFELLKHNIDPYKDLKKLSFSKNTLHTEVVYAVRDKKVDAGIVRTDQLERMAAAGKIDLRNFRILNNQDIKSFPFFLSSDLYPEWPFAAMKNVPEKVRQQVKQTLLAIPANSRAAINGKYIGWLSAKDYSTVNQLMKQLKVGHHAN